MAKTPCKSLRRNGTPCQGNGLPRYNGYCIAHAAPEKVWGWRSRGGKASSTAARADKRIPERLRGAIEKVTQGMDDLLEEKIEPAALSAISRSARVLIDLYRLADEEMDQIRGEEDAVAVAQVAGGLGDHALLEAADAFTAWQNQYRIDSLIDQGLATLQRDETQDADQPSVPVLTAAGRQRFGYQRLTKYTQGGIDMLRSLAQDPPPDDGALTAVLIDLYKMRMAMAEALEDFAPAPAPVLDPLTGQPLTQLPAQVKPATVPVAGPEEAAQAAKNLQDQLRQVNELTREAEVQYEEEVGHQFDIRDELPDEFPHEFD